MGPQRYSAMSNRTGVTTNERQSREEEGKTFSRNDTPSTILQPRICNVILVADEIRFSHTWPAGVNRSLLVEHIMPKINSAATEHIVWSEKFLDDYYLLTKSATAAWGCSSNTACALGKGTWVLSTWLPDGCRNQLVLRDVLYMPDLRINA